MALKLDERYPGRANPPSIDYPQGSFKNRTAPDARDGTYLEQDWANDQQGFLQSILSYFGVVANGQTDKVGASQYFDALTSTPTESRKGMPRIGTQAEVDAGVVDSVVVTPKKLLGGGGFLLGSPGYVSLPSWLGGFKLQWGSASVSTGTLTVTLPIACDVSCYGAVAAGQTTVDGTVSASAWVESTAISRTQVFFKTIASSANGNVTQARGIYWVSIGK